MSPVPPFSELTKVTRLDLHTYSANLANEYCIGTVPNGGYVASCVLNAVEAHLSPRNQTDTITAHFTFVNRTEVGPCVIVVDDVKLGRGTSVVHATLYQAALLDQAPWITPGKSKKQLVAYLTNTNFAFERGLTLPTGWTLSPPPPPPPVDLAKLAAGQDPNWEPMQFSLNGWRRVFRNLHYFRPRGRNYISAFASENPQPEPKNPLVIDLWVKLASGENFSAASLGYLADSYPYVIESFRPSGKESKQEPFAFDAMFWYPTLVMNVDFKKALPKGGAEFLFTRVTAKHIKNGRYDLEVLIMDETGELVAICGHSNLVLGAERNVGKREVKESKI